MENYALFHTHSEAGHAPHPGGFYAPAWFLHLGCQIEAVGDGFTCPCHGSQFSRILAISEQAKSFQVRVEQNEQGLDPLCAMNLYNNRLTMITERA
jgi:hypothetical protein